jgi:hypothetical protein
MVQSVGQCWLMTTSKLQSRMSTQNLPSLTLASLPDDQLHCQPDTGLRLICQLSSMLRGLNTTKNSVEYCVGHANWEGLTYCMKCLECHPTLQRQELVTSTNYFTFLVFSRSHQNKLLCSIHCTQKLTYHASKFAIGMTSIAEPWLRFLLICLPFWATLSPPIALLMQIMLLIVLLAGHTQVF